MNIKFLYYDKIKGIYYKLTSKKWFLILLVIIGFIMSLLIPRFNLINQYMQLFLMFIGINIILTVSLNLVNGYMGEFSIGHAGFMAIGAYTASLLTVKFIPAAMTVYLFPIAIISGGLAAAFVGLILSIPSFRTRGDYLALVTLAFNMIIKSIIENIDYVGGPRGLLGMDKLTTLPWVFFWVVAAVWIIRNLIFSNYGRGIISIREDEIACELMGVNTQKLKIIAFVVSSFFAGVAGGLFAHLLQFINPRTFDIIKSTEILIMVYLGGIGSIAGSILGATIYTVLLEILRPMGIWRMVLMPLLLVLLMIFRPKGIMGLKEFRFIIPIKHFITLSKWKPNKDKLYGSVKS